MMRRRSTATAVALLLALGGCMTRPPAPVDERITAQPPTRLSPPPVVSPPSVHELQTPVQTYVVKRGETLAQIALDHGLDYRELAMWNNIDNPNVIRVGQVLVLAPPGQGGGTVSANGTVTAPLVVTPPVAINNEARPPAVAPVHGVNSVTYKSEPKAVKMPYSEQALAQLRQAVALAAASAPSSSAPPVAATTPATIANASPSMAPAPKGESSRVPEIDDDKTDWVWPATGKIVSGFSETANLKGIDIAGKAGQPVLASAAGKVVYAGTGLRGYGKLIIVKHNATFLSAYAHNREILVKEGQVVAKGQKIAEMGDSDADQVKLHFEIRRLGKPIDPAKMLPPG
jgi:lipoprotein NlpD